MKRIGKYLGRTIVEGKDINALRKNEILAVYDNNGKLVLKYLDGLEVVTLTLDGEWD